MDLSEIQNRDSLSLVINLGYIIFYIIFYGIFIPSPYYASRAEGKADVL